MLLLTIIYLFNSSIILISFIYILNENSAEKSIATLKSDIDNYQYPAFLCTALKSDNPNYLAIIHANKTFCQNFNISEEELFAMMEKAK